jgi:hypothetical protein
MWFAEGGAAGFGRLWVIPALVGAQGGRRFAAQRAGAGRSGPERAGADRSGPVSGPQRTGAGRESAMAAAGWLSRLRSQSIDRPASAVPLWLGFRSGSAR